MKYLDVIYKQRKETNYPDFLAQKICTDYFLRENASLLDVGCGTGTYIKAFSKYVKKVEGVDKDTVNFETDPLPFMDESFDYVFCKSVIEHVANTDHFLTEIKRVMKKGGVLLILTPAWEYNYKDFFNDYTHIKPFHRKGLQDALLINDFRCVFVDYFYHLPFMWGNSFLSFIPKFFSLFSKWKWKNHEQTEHRILIRFSQEVQLIAYAVK